ncbi:hypothetical protein [Microbispora amethystogenes]|uniref:Uncharacterized protein n=1 Tax=Microbispora amethystogenes TaxID=1427754 RepID=A0ABQ4F6M9_9ACTN|nr:hypothetical protein [Microbispora amethystogenes]GIH30455.1 hypothetical protein Mam01_06190 [Microbispora amethystogenes]
MQWQLAALFGAGGGLVVEIIGFWGYLTSWQRDRHRARASRKRSMPALLRYVDPLADSLVAITRLLLGAVAGGLMHDQISGVVAAIAVGAAGPALLRQLGTTRVVQAALLGNERTDASAGQPDQGNISPPPRSATMNSVMLVVGEEQRQTEEVVE